MGSGLILFAPTEAGEIFRGRMTLLSELLRTIRFTQLFNMPLPE
jgi:hypothetical protein